jgi:hypothetical protein
LKVKGGQEERKYIGSQTAHLLIATNADDKATATSARTMSPAPEPGINSNN